MVKEINGYRVVENGFLGKGGFGAVYKAEKEGVFYAIKVFQTEFIKDEYGKQRLDGEIKALQMIVHPNVVKYYEHGTFVENEFEYAYIVMDFVDGLTLDNYIGILSEVQIKEIIVSVLNTLGDIHKLGVIHRDLKPSNIIINQKGVPIILDFGVSKLIDYTSITPTGSTLGTYWYMSPEQIKNSKEVDDRADYFSIGMIIYQLITGKLPYTATNMPELVKQITDQYPKPPSEINPEVSSVLEDVILTLIEKEPHQRYQSIEAILSAISEEEVARISMIPEGDYFFVRLMHNERTTINEAIADGLIENIDFPVHFFAQYKPTLETLKQSEVRLIGDPSTARLRYTAFSGTESLKALPYAPVDGITPIQVKDLASISSVKAFVQAVIKYQTDNGLVELTAPYFFTENPDDELSSINIQLLKETLNYRDLNHPDFPVWATLCIGTETLYDDDVKNKILNRYVRNKPDGYIIYGDQIGNSSNEAQLYHYADLLKKLQISSGSPVIAGRVSSLGLVLMSLGVSGFSSGLTGLDSFKQELLSDAKPEVPFAREPKYYIPALLTSITLPKGVISKIRELSESSVAGEVMCTCKYCADILTNEPAINKNLQLHYLLQRKKEIAQFETLSLEGRRLLMLGKVNEAIRLHKIIKGEDIKLISDIAYLTVWKKLLERG